MGKIFTFSGPRGVGKTSVMTSLSERDGIRPIVPYTTRNPRPGEVEGRDYHFVTDYEFDAIRRTRGMFDVLTLKGGKYGTPLEEFDRVIGGPNDSVEHIRTISLAAGSALELRKEIGNSAVRSLFILPECWDNIEKQMLDSGIPEEQIRERRASEPTDLTMLPNFDRIIINEYGNTNTAYTAAVSYILKITGIDSASGTDVISA